MQKSHVQSLASPAGLGKTLSETLWSCCRSVQPILRRTDCLTWHKTLCRFARLTGSLLDSVPQVGLIHWGRGQNFCGCVLSCISCKTSERAPADPAILFFSQGPFSVSPDGSQLPESPGGVLSRHPHQQELPECCSWGSLDSCPECFPGKLKTF